MAKLNSGTRIYGNASIDANLAILGTNVSTSTTTGALTVNGGLGVQGNVNIGEQLIAQQGIQNTAIGNVSPSTGNFTNLTSSGNVTAAAVTANGSITAGTTLSAAGGGTIRIARRWDESATNSVNFFPGDIALIRIYERALSQDEISQNFNSARRRFNI